MLIQGFKPYSKAHKNTLTARDLTAINSHCSKNYDSFSKAKISATPNFGNAQRIDPNFHQLQNAVEASPLSLEKLITKSVTEDNLLGKGANSKVYDMPDLKGYVIKVFNGYDPSYKTGKLALGPYIGGVFGCNVGQPIAGVAEGILILQKQTGVEHSVKNWSDVTKNAVPITKHDAEKFADEIKKLAQMPEHTYLEFAKTVKQVADCGYKVDSINPNNYLIDFKAQKINVVDVDKATLPFQKNSAGDMVCALLDFTLFRDYHDLLKKPEQKSFFKDSSIIAKKCCEAAQKTGLTTDGGVFDTFLDKVDKYFANDLPANRGYKVRLSEMKKLVHPRALKPEKALSTKFVDILHGALKRFRLV